MIRKFLTNLFVVSLVLLTVSCEKDNKPAVSEDDLYNAAGNESFVENSLASGGSSTSTALWVTPELPNADESAVISFRAGKKSPLYGYTGDVYAHIGILEYGTWKFVQADWTENIDKCKFAKDPSAENTWHLELKPSIREYFQSGSTAVTQIGIVIRSADSQMKGIEEDRFITVKDDVYKPFQPGETVSAPMPSGCRYGINADIERLKMLDTMLGTIQNEAKELYTVLEK